MAATTHLAAATRHPAPAARLPAVLPWAHLPVFDVMRRVGHWAHLPVFDAMRRVGHWVRLQVGRRVHLRVGRRVHLWEANRVRRSDHRGPRRRPVDPYRAGQRKQAVHPQAVHLRAVHPPAMARLVHRPGALRYPTAALKRARPLHAVPVGFHRPDRRTTRPHVLRAMNRPNRPREVPPRTRRRSPSGGSPVERCMR